MKLFIHGFINNCLAIVLHKVFFESDFDHFEGFDFFTVSVYKLEHKNTSGLVKAVPLIISIHQSHVLPNTKFQYHP